MCERVRRERKRGEEEGRKEIEKTREEIVTDTVKQRRETLFNSYNSSYNIASTMDAIVKTTTVMKRKDASYTSENSRAGRVN